MAAAPREVVVNVKAKIDPALLPDQTATDAVLKDVLEEYVWRRDGIIGSAEPEWFRHFLGERGYRLVLVRQEQGA